MAYEPTLEQLAILAHDRHRHSRVLAGPGTGKSATVVALIERLFADRPAPRIKLITFTRAATAELAKKVSDHHTAAAELTPIPCVQAARARRRTDAATCPR